MDIVDDFEIMTFILLANTAACSSSLVIDCICFLIWLRHDFIFEVTIFKSVMKRTYPSAFEYDSQINCLWNVDVEIE